jgi:hypothetical protein
LVEELLGMNLWVLGLDDSAKAALLSLGIDLLQPREP